MVNLKWYGELLAFFNYRWKEKKAKEHDLKKKIKINLDY